MLLVVVGALVEVVAVRGLTKRSEVVAAVGKSGVVVDIVCGFFYDVSVSKVREAASLSFCKPADIVTVSELAYRLVTQYSDEGRKDRSRFDDRLLSANSLAISEAYGDTGSRNR